jgi:hypothetical protein
VENRSHWLWSCIGCGIRLISTGIRKKHAENPIETPEHPKFPNICVKGILCLALNDNDIGN